MGAGGHLGDELRANLGDKVVTVLALRVDGKKLSQALFRQIPRADCLTAEHQFDDTLKPWGRVAYKIGREGDQWLLAECDGQLVRCSLEMPSLSSWTVERHEKGLVEYEQKVREAPGEHIAKIFRPILDLHREELPKAKAQLEKQKKRHAALLPLQSLPQLFLA